ncbi:Heavy metal-associated isoprenylated plant protein 23 [Linum grandiflorum]
MGIGGTLEYLCELMANSNGHKKKRKQMQSVELKVRMDCDGCERVKSVEINRKQQKVTVTGYVEPHKVLKKAKSTGKRSEIWPYIPYNTVAQPYIAGTYDKKAPPGHVRNVEQSAPTTYAAAGDPYTTMFSDDNPNACSVM